ncbi:MAG TPA: pectate lyase [Longimicrobium sp.]|jgi:PelA/Pel-15E family pectate lyase
MAGTTQRTAALAAAALLLAAGCRTLPAQDPARNPVDSIARLPGAAVERDTTPLLGPARISALPAAEREAWTQYVETSRRDRARDRALLAEEMRTLGRERMERAAYARKSFEVEDRMTEAWFRGDSARRMAETILSYQTPSGGWSKHVDMSGGPRRPGQSFFSESDSWQYIATLDNNSTTEEMRFLARAYAAHGDARWRDAFLRGLGWLLRAQFPNGCWPQVYPLQGGYHDAATFNDDAIVHAAALLRDVARGEYAFVTEEERRRADAAVSRALDCILASQVVVGGKRTVWGQQHDPLTLRPTSARSYEPASLASKESAGITRFLMSLPSPDARVVEAVHAAAAWFRENRIYGYVYDFQTGRREQAGAGPLWARMYEIGTNRPVFSNRDGVVLYDYEQLTDRRTGYGWYAEEPASALRAYERWAARHPAPAGS